MASKSGIDGVYFLKTRVGAPNPYGVRWKVDGKKETKWLPTEEIRAKFARQIERERRLGLTADLTIEQKEEYRAIKASVGDYDWRVVIAAGVDALNAKQKENRTVARSVREYLDLVADKVKRSEMSVDTQRHKKQKLEMLAEEFGDTQIHEVTAEDLETWLEDLGIDQAYTWNNYRKHVRAFFAHFVPDDKDNPAEQVEPRNPSIEHVGILTPEQTKQLFDFALSKRPELLGRLALEAFAGLRFSSAYRLEKTDINFAEKGITLPRHKIKVNRRFYIDELPENLWLWIARTNDACWAMNPREYTFEKSKLFVDSGVPHPRNCLRHSFCTYHIAAFKNPGRTAAILTHRNQQMLWQHYMGISNQVQGLAYFGIVPAVNPGR